MPSAQATPILPDGRHLDVRRSSKVVDRNFISDKRKPAAAGPLTPDEFNWNL